MKIAIAQITTDPGQIEANEKKILEAIAAARAQGADLVVFPELTVPGYGVMDLCFNESFINDNLAALQRIAGATTGIAAIVGFIDRDTNARRPGGRPALYNSAALLSDGAILGIQDKTLLPTYDIFFEERYFLPARGQKLFALRDERVGIQICEDLWETEYAVRATSELIALKPSIIVNISASPFHSGKLTERLQQVTRLYPAFGGTFIYTNLVGSFDGYEGEIVFDGRSLVIGPDGNLQTQGAPFAEDLVIFKTVPPPGTLRVPTDLPPSTPTALPQLTPEEEIHDALALGIREYLRRQKLTRVYVGLSGGVDSAVVAALAVTALGANRVTGVTMPSHITGSDTKSDAVLVAKNLGIPCHERPIIAEYEAWQREFRRAVGREPQELTIQNKQARIRGAILMEYSNEDRGAVVLATGNKTELAVGYCTLYGDMCGALAVIGDVSKLRVYDLARHINRRAGREIVPKSIIDRIPTAELASGQTDRDNLPADYPILSPLVDEIIEDQPSLEILAQRYPRDVVERTLRLIHANEFKRRQAAPAIRVTKRAFGVGRRVPMGHEYLR